MDETQCIENGSDVRSPKSLPISSPSDHTSTSACRGAEFQIPDVNASQCFGLKIPEKHPLKPKPKHHVTYAPVSVFTTESSTTVPFLDITQLNNIFIQAPYNNHDFPTITVVHPSVHLPASLATLSSSKSM